MFTESTCSYHFTRHQAFLHLNAHLNNQLYALKSEVAITLRSYGTDHVQRRICSHLWVCSRFNSCRGRGHGTCFACKCTALSVLHDIHEQHPFWAIIKPRANPRVWASATLREICTAAILHSLHSVTNMQETSLHESSHYEKWGQKAKEAITCTTIINHTLKSEVAIVQQCKNFLCNESRLF